MTTEIDSRFARSRTHTPTGTYNGAELRTQSARPGAYDAMRLPSLFNGQRRPPGTAPEPSTVWTPPTTTPPAVAQKQPKPRAGTPRPDRKQKVLRELKQPRPAAAAYQPREGSVPSQLLAYLHAHGGHLKYAEISQRFGIPTSSTTAVFKNALSGGLVVRVIVDGRSALALPGYVSPASAPPPGKRLLALQARLQKGLDDVARLQQEVQELQSAALAEHDRAAL